MPDGLLSGVLFVSVVAAFLVSAVFILWQMADERMRAKAQREEAEERRVLEERASMLEKEASELRASARRLSKPPPPSEAEDASLASNDGAGSVAADAEEKGVGALASGRAARTSVPWRRAASSIVVTRPIVEEDEGAAANEPATRPRCNTTHV